MLDIPLMRNNITAADKEALIAFLRESDRFTNGPKVREFEAQWSQWLGGGCHCLFVNSGSSANFLTMAAIRETRGAGEVIVAPIGWSSDLGAIFAAGLTPVFVDVNLRNMAMDDEAAIAAMTPRTKAVLLTHVLGYNALTDRLLDACRLRGVLLVEDVCESHGATFHGRKCGSFGDAANFSFYYAHHMTTIEGGMVCSRDPALHRLLRMFRSHGMLRECDDPGYIDEVTTKYPELHGEFIFTVPGYNMRSTELNAVLGLEQLRRLDRNIARRRENYDYFISRLDAEKFFTAFDSEGNSNYAFVVMPNPGYARRRQLYEKVTAALRDEGVEFRRGTAGGGNLLRQPYVRSRFPALRPQDFPNAEFIHAFGLYTGNYPDLEREKVDGLCRLLNAL